ncbi:carboxylate-amine ligase [Nocardioides iriomotensis]|uniref:Putative glutamate--cysteine ligase 2 n=1 Tax=Nocardioides iriomotensis TaxID=715784 RepID=A0A4Q5J2L6_9ACTN|nr:glutamate--cysteine ligase [Nocardioides iriomotensis]RYU12817.1 YbdK family carboxylate-amine ligase [Nocardioides iriomotensis]
MTLRQIGVEEELMLVDPDTLALAAVAHHALRADERDGVEKELFLQQIETSTEPARTADDLARIVRAGRREVGEAAAAAGVRAVALGLPVLADDGADVTPDDRYRRIRAEYGELADQALACAMHVHVEVDDAEEAVAVTDRLRPWLPVLLALSANSPYWRGRDTAHASWRSQIWTRWPTGGPSDPFGDPAGYRASIERLQSWGAALDPGMLYLDVRPAERYPTVEIRVADVCLEAEDAVLLGLLCRGLVETAARAWHAGEPVDPWRVDELRAMSWRAARHGLAGPLVHPATRELTPTRPVVSALLAHVRPALADTGDEVLVADLFEQLVARGNGAVRQRAVHEATGDLTRVVADLADHTEAGWRRDAV